MFPEAGGNPYLRRLREALAAEGVSFVSGHSGLLGWRWLRRHAGEGIVLYFHWLARHYTRRRAPSLRLALLFMLKLLFARALGYRIVWTCHNILPHESLERTWLHVWVRRACCRLAERIIVHSEVSRRRLNERFGCGDKAVVVPHGHFAGAYGEPLERAAARRALGLPEGEFIYGFLGRVRPYKGVERLVEAFRAVAGPGDRLVVAGLADREYGERLRRLVGEDPNVDLHLAWLPDEKVLQWLGAVDVLVFPFRDILNSGSVILAMSYGVLCVVPRMGSLPEILPEGTVVYLSGADDDALRRALDRVRRLPPDAAAAMRRRAREAALALRWETAARRIVEALR